ncbi:NTP transferase domain-containing protein [Rhodobacter sp. CZR27]|uniref:nucleotidyltransferase family protein n=1 Tax=Rhodobacter sp. CZR27 TaxID=2033869 RepID=UPI000BBED464|nr:nucleotidyltransferase family protein [Rhodobacter sp. CZR27]
MAVPAPVVILLAAGASSRMRGADKLLEPVAGGPLIAVQAGKALRAGLEVIVTLAPDRPAREAALRGLPVRIVHVERAAEGIAASIRAGVAAAPEGAAVMILLADLPDIEASDLRHLADLHRADPAAILRATAEGGRPGHPILFPADLRGDLCRLQGDVGARDLLRREGGRLRLVPLAGSRAVTDLDTPEDWAHWRRDGDK